MLVDSFKTGATFDPRATFESLKLLQTTVVFLAASECVTFPSFAEALAYAKEAVSEGGVQLEVHDGGATIIRGETLEALLRYVG